VKIGLNSYLLLVLTLSSSIDRLKKRRAELMKELSQVDQDLKS
jgi:hypothetical protein